MANTPHAYAEEAYTPDQLHRRPAGECQHSRKFRTFAAGGERLAHREPSVDISPMHDWQHNTPEALRGYEADPTIARLKDPECRVDQPLRWDEECIRFTSHTKRAFIIGITKVLGSIGGGDLPYAPSLLRQLQLSCLPMTQAQETIGITSYRFLVGDFL
ncbi:hypothetical protein [Halomonas borealis]|uniref:hypothetical protein n=1 Tax=Halomonas borealis TaxID=2508710 RepID=UPI0010A097CC|nr:hypothetical protein [Halomonas borealis]